LRAINAGQQVKETTLERIAVKLRVPIEHLIGSSAGDKSENVVGGDQSDVKLQQLDATGLRKVFEDTSDINWFLQIDQMPNELESLLTKLENALRGWFWHFNGFGDAGEHKDNLRAQIEFIKTSTAIDECVAELATRNLKICGGTYVFWEKDQPYDKERNYWVPQLLYCSTLRVALSIVKKEKANPTVTVWTGWHPPQQFNESELNGIDFVQVDNLKVWDRAMLQGREISAEQTKGTDHDEHKT
jgi:hypothetical protein